MTPFPKSRQLARGPKRPARIKATTQQWVKIRQAKLGTCRGYKATTDCEGRAELHHIVPRSWGGDDLADNIVPLCTRHHRDVTERRDRNLTSLLAWSLTDAEYSYCIGKLGEGALERLFGIVYVRALGQS